MQKRKAPVYFIGHGSPMYAVENNSFTQSLVRMREVYPHPKAILCISAHWMTEGSWVTNMQWPKTIHDFYGFPPPLFDVQYPSPGSPEIAAHLSRTITDPKIHLDNEMWGLDHGAWAVLRHIFPEANTPVLQLSLNMEQPPEYHYQLGTKLRDLREDGILIVGSGNIVHNLRRIVWEKDARPFTWAVEFDEWVKRQLLSRNVRALLDDFTASEEGRLSVPTPEHYYPLLYALGASGEKDLIKFNFEEIHNGSISMRTIIFDEE